MKTAEDYANAMHKELEKDNTRRERQKLSLAFSFLTGADRDAYKKHTRTHGTTLESLRAFGDTIMAGGGVAE